MYSTIQPAPHWKDADLRDIERELIDLIVRSPAAIDTDSMARIQRNDYEFRWALANPDRLFSHYTIRVDAVQTMQSRQWTSLRRSRGIRNGGLALVDVRWSYSKTSDTPVRGVFDWDGNRTIFGGYKGGPLMNPLVRIQEDRQ